MAVRVKINIGNGFTMLLDTFILLLIPFLSDCFI